MQGPLSLSTLRNDPSIILDFFFRSMEEGYARKAQRAKAIPGHRSSRQIFYIVKPWSVTDTWHVTPVSNFSGGSTHIYFEGKLVWMMQYFGVYPPELIPYLKEALAAEYREHRWNGGRGPRAYLSSDKKFIYNNRPEAKGFTNFHGIETIKPRDEVAMPQNSGWHRYHGGLML